MPYNYPDGRQLLTIGKGTADVLRGTDDVKDWDDEELAYGRRRDKKGNFTGTPQRMIPAACYTELKRRQVFDAESTLGKRVAVAAQYLADVAEGEIEPSAGRMRACEMLLDRVVGKPKESVDVRMSIMAQVEELPWVQALKKSADRHRPYDNSTASGDDDIIDIEVVASDPLCLCGCGQPPRPGSDYLNARHEAHAKAKESRVHDSPQLQPDPILEDDDFIEDDDPEDDPVIW